MLRRIQYILFLAGLIAVAHLAQGLNYMHLTHLEGTWNGETIGYFTGDTIWGPVHSNDSIIIGGSPVFYDLVSTSASHFRGGPGSNPQFLGPPPFFNAPQVSIPHTMSRDEAIEQNHYFDSGFHAKARVILEDHNLHILWGTRGTPFDNSNVENHAIEDVSMVFFDCPVWISGTCHTVLTLGSSHSILLVDNILYPSTDISNGIPDEYETARLALISEQNIIVANTPANGRANSGGLGQEQTDPNLTSIVISAYLVALGETFTFAQQNDIWNSYQCPCAPDERGTIYLYGGMTMRRRGYVHRSNHGGTGYLTHYRWDERIRHWDLGLFPGSGSVVTPEEIDFGDVAVGTTAWDTVFVVGGNPIFSGAITPTPFYSPAGYSYQEPVVIPVSFTPPLARPYSSHVYFYLDGLYHSIPLSGTGIPPSAPLLTEFSVHPNPFNPIANFRFTLGQSEAVRLDVYNITGQLVVTIVNEPLTAGEHSFRFDGSAQASGLYFARLQTGNLTKTTKLLLVK